MVLIIDFGSQYTELLAYQIRKNRVFSEIREWSNPDLLKDIDKYEAIVISGSPCSAKDELHEDVFKGILEIPKPKLCVCYGMQVIHKMLGGTVVYKECPEFGNKKVSICKHHPLVDGISMTFATWMSHEDSVTELAPGFESVAQTNSCQSIAIDDKRQIYTLQFHPEVEHCECGERIIQNFLFLICRIKENWQLDGIIENKIKQIQQDVGREKVFLALSGGVDSSVVAKLLQKSAVDAYYIFVDTGLGFQPGSKEILDFLKEDLGDRFIFIDAKERFFGALKGVTSPEEKRKTIGTLFVQVFKDEIQARGGSKFLAQGTIHSDLIESGKKNKANTIKTHHNTVDDLKKSFQLVEPIADLFKNEVRAIGRQMGIPEFIISAKPFPGPGYAIRVMGEVIEEKVEILRRVDAIILKELSWRKMYGPVSQAFSVMVGHKSTGVSGDNRQYGYVVAIRAIESENMMTAKATALPIETLLEISSEITNQIPEITRVVYDLTSKPPGTIEWE